MGHPFAVRVAGDGGTQQAGDLMKPVFRLPDLILRKRRCADDDEKDAAAGNRFHGDHAQVVHQLIAANAGQPPIQRPLRGLAVLQSAMVGVLTIFVLLVFLPLEDVWRNSVIGTGCRAQRRQSSVLIMFHTIKVGSRTAMLSGAGFARTGSNLSDRRNVRPPMQRRGREAASRSRNSVSAP